MVIRICYAESLLAGGKVYIPRKLSKMLASKKISDMKLTRGLHGCLYLFTAQQWEESLLNYTKTMKADEELVRLGDLLFSAGCGVKMSGEYFEIPEEYVKFADLKENLVWSVLPNRLEIWSRENWLGRYVPPECKESR